MFLWKTINLMELLATIGSGRGRKEGDKLQTGRAGATLM